MLARRHENGSVVLVCVTGCLEQVGTDSWTDDFYETDELDYPATCAHCYACGYLVLEPLHWCAEHGLACPDSLWLLTAQARAFANALTRTTRKWITDAMWRAVETKHYAEPWLTGGELAAKVIAP